MLPPHLALTHARSNHFLQPNELCRSSAPSLNKRVALSGEALKHEPFPAEEPRHHLRELRLKAKPQAEKKGGKLRAKSATASKHEPKHVDAIYIHTKLCWFFYAY